MISDFYVISMSRILMSYPAKNDLTKRIVSDFHERQKERLTVLLKTTSAR
jgi:hypothetical protein